MIDEFGSNQGIAEEIASEHGAKAPQTSQVPKDQISWDLESLVVEVAKKEPE